MKLRFKPTNSPLLLKVEKILHLLIQDEENEATEPRMQALIHELQTHQIELEVQNEELREAHHELSSVKDQYQQLYDCAPVAYLTLNRDGRIIEANQKAYGILGVSRSRVIGKPMTDYIAPESQDVWYLYMRAVFSERTKQASELVIKTNPPTIVRSECVAVSPQDQEEDQCWMVLINISLQKQAEADIKRLNRELEHQVKEQTAEIKENLARLKAVLNTATDAIITISRKGIIESVNPATEAMFGYRDKELIGQSIDVIFPDHHSNNLKNYVKNFGSNQGSYIVENPSDLFAKRKDGKLFPVSLSVNRIDDEDCFTGIVRDISDRIELEKEVLHRAEEERTRIGRELHDSVAQVIIGIGMRLKALSRKLKASNNPLPEELLELSEAMARMSTELEALGREIRTIVTNLASLDLDEVNLSDALTCLVDSCQTYTSSVITLSLPENIAINDTQVATQLFRIVQEALHNAIKHTNGSDIRIELRQSQNSIRVSVIDNGGGGASSGTEPHSLFRLSGKGVNNMKYRANIIGASLDITSKVGSGTRVECVLPYRI